jgi:hypothetical protein
MGGRHHDERSAPAVYSRRRSFPESGMIVSAAFSLLSRTLAPSAVRTGFFEMRRLTEIREIAP